MQLRADSIVIHEQVIQVDLTSVEIAEGVDRVTVELVTPSGRAKRVSMSAYAFDESDPRPRPVRLSTPRA